MEKRWGKCDYRQLVALQKRLEKLMRADQRRFFEAAARELAARLLAKVIKRTPVGRYAKQDVLDEAGNKVTYKSGKRKGEVKQQVVKKGGTLRRGWTAKTESEAESAAGGSNAVEYANGLPVTRKDDLYEIEIINPVSYAPYVEYGHRTRGGKGWVKGRYMLTISEKEIEQLAPALLEKKLMKMLGECFDGK